MIPIIGTGKYFSIIMFGFMENHFLFKCNCKSEDTGKAENVFIRNGCTSWSDSIFFEPTENFSHQFVWNNRFIRIIKKLF